jgi:hypothetical protein
VRPTRRQNSRPLRVVLPLEQPTQRFGLLWAAPPLAKRVHDLALSPDGRTLASPSGASALLWDVSAHGG